MIEDISSSRVSGVSGGLNDRVIAQILQHIATSTYHLRIHGEENDQVLQSVDIVVSSVTFLGQSSPLTFEFQEGEQKGFQVRSAEVRVNGAVFVPQAEELAWVQSVVKLAKKSRWSKLTLSSGLTNEEWLAFIKSISVNTENGTPAMANGGFPHVVVERSPA